MEAIYRMVASYFINNKVELLTPAASKINPSVMIRQIDIISNDIREQGGEQIVEQLQILKKDIANCKTQQELALVYYSFCAICRLISARGFISYVIPTECYW